MMLWVRRVARAIGVAAGLLFAALGVLLDSTGATLGWVIVGLFAGVTALAPSYVRRLEEAPERRRRARGGFPWRPAVLAAATTTTTLLAISGMFAVMGSAAAPVMILIAIAIMGWALMRYRERGRARDGTTIDDVCHRSPLTFEAADTAGWRNEGSDGFDDGPAIGDDVGALSDEELCLAWRRSFLLIEHLDDPRLSDHLARRRRGYLDELERRHPRQFAQWLASGARAASDPARFLIITASGSTTPRQGRR
jgi:hypothetical protein